MKGIDQCAEHRVMRYTVHKNSLVRFYIVLDQKDHFLHYRYLALLPRIVFDIYDQICLYPILQKHD